MTGFGGIRHAPSGRNHVPPSTAEASETAKAMHPYAAADRMAARDPPILPTEPTVPIGHGINLSSSDTPPFTSTAQHGHYWGPVTAGDFAPVPSHARLHSAVAIRASDTLSLAPANAPSVYDTETLLTAAAAVHWKYSVPTVPPPKPAVVGDIIRNDFSNAPPTTSSRSQFTSRPTPVPERPVIPTFPADHVQRASDRAPMALDTVTAVTYGRVAALIMEPSKKQ
jgi:hypothetical protein